MNSKNSITISTPMAIVLAGVIIAGAVCFGQTGAGGAMSSTGSSNLPNAGITAPQAPPQSQTADNVPKITDKDHIRGNREAKVALIEYSDLECPFCKRFHPTAQQVLEEYGDEVSWVYRHFPLSFHANAQKETEAAECANEQGGGEKFWAYVDAISERTTSNGTGFALDKLTPLAEELELDGEKFRECLDSDKYAQHVKDEMAGGQAAGVNGTPGNIILNRESGETRLIPGAVPFETIRAAIEEVQG